MNRARINENQKVTLTLKQLKRLVKESINMDDLRKDIHSGKQSYGKKLFQIKAYFKEPQYVLNDETDRIEDWVLLDVYKENNVGLTPHGDVTGTFQIRVIVSDDNPYEFSVFKRGNLHKNFSSKYLESFGEVVSPETIKSFVCRGWFSHGETIGLDGKKATREFEKTPITFETGYVDENRKSIKRFKRLVKEHFEEPEKDALAKELDVSVDELNDEFEKCVNTCLRRMYGDKYVAKVKPLYKNAYYLIIYHNEVKDINYYCSIYFEVFDDEIRYEVKKGVWYAPGPSVRTGVVRSDKLKKDVEDMVSIIEPMKGLVRSQK